MNDGADAAGCPVLSRLAERAARIRIGVVLHASGDSPTVVWPTDPRAADALLWLIANASDAGGSRLYRAVTLGLPEGDTRPLTGIVPIRSEIERLVRPEASTRLLADLRDCLVADLSDADRLITALGFTADDLALADSVESAADDLAEKLADAYECNVLLHGLSKMLNRPDGLEEQITQACVEIAGSLGFSWAGLSFHDDARLPSAVRGRVLGGGPGCPALGDLTEMCDRILVIDRCAVSKTSAMTYDHAALGTCLLQPIVIGEHVIATLVLAGREAHRREIDSYDLTLVESVGGFLGPFIENAALDEERERAFYGMLRALSAAVDAKDPYTRGHSERVALLSAMLAEAMGAGREQVERVRVAGIVHDIGKIGVPEQILTKPDRLTDEEFEIIKTHPMVGFTILENVHELADVLPAVLHHHERWDGKGYPGGLRGDAIPEIARILAVADSFDAMSSTRAYRHGMSQERAIEQIRNGAGTQFDPSIVRVFLRLDLTAYRRTLGIDDRAGDQNARSMAA